jgi:hypothetical protein
MLISHDFIPGKELIERHKPSGSSAAAIFLGN